MSFLFRDFSKPKVIDISLGKSNLIKLLAVALMVVDHVGVVFFPQLFFLRLIGRLAFFLFAYQLAVGYIHTKDLKRYFLRLLGIGLISQIPYHFANPWEPNIFFTLCLGLLAIFAFDRLKIYFSIPLIGLICIVAEYFRFDYGALGILVILLSYVFLENFIVLLASQLALWMVYITLSASNAVGLGFNSLTVYLPVGFLSYLVIRLLPNVNFQMNKYVYYFFYPAHLVLIGIIWLLLFRLFC